MWSEILYGFQVATTPTNLLLCFLGVLLGTLVGVLPGIGPAGAMAFLLPISLKITPLGTFIMLARRGVAARPGPRAGHGTGAHLGRRLVAPAGEVLARHL